MVVIPLAAGCYGTGSADSIVKSRISDGCKKLCGETVENGRQRVQMAI